MKRLRAVLRQYGIKIHRSVSLRMQQNMVSLKMAAGANFAALDAACVGYACINEAYVLTADHNEMDQLESMGLAQFFWFR